MLSLYFFLLFLMCIINPLSAEELPTINMKEGRNEITFSIHNKWGNNLNNLKINIDKNTLPSWIKVESSNKEIFIARDSYGTDKLKMVLEVVDAPCFSCGEIHLFFADENENRWNYTLKMQVISEESLNLQHFDTLYNNFPNPFNPSTTIRYSISENKHTTLFIYNSLGQKIRTLVNELQTPGIHAVQWDGCNDEGQKVSSGVYIYQVLSGKYKNSKQMILVE